MKTRAPICVSAVALAALLSLFPATAAAAETTPAAAWKLVAATGPTNLAPRQSEVQKLVIGAQGGTFTLSRKTPGTGTGTPVSARGGLSVTAGSTTATILAGSFEAGSRITAAAAIAPETTILSCTPTCEAGSTLTLSRPAVATNTHLGVTAYTRKIAGLAQSGLHPGDLISGTGLAPGTTIVSLEGSELTASEPTNAEYSSGQISFSAEERTAPIPYDASPEALEAALEALPAFGEGTFAVSGGPGGDAAHPYLIAFGGPEFEDEDVEELKPDATALSGTPHYASLLTTVPGGQGTGAIGVFAENVGAATGGKGATMHIGPLPAGVEISGAPDGGSGWSCEAPNPSEATCTALAPVAGLGKAETIAMPVAVSASGPFEASAEARIEGGGAAPDTYSFPIVVSPHEAPPGAAAFWAGAFDAAGQPATQAASHPYSALTYFLVNTVRTPFGQIAPSGLAKDIYVDIPPGFAGNPMVTERCPQSNIVCGAKAAVGALTVSTGFGRGEGGSFTTTAFSNDVPAWGTAAQFTTKVVSPLQSLLGSLRSEEDFGVRIFAPHAASTLDKLFKSYAVLEGAPKGAEGKAFLTLQADCAEEARQQRAVAFRFDTWSDPGDFHPGSALQPPVTGCEKLHFHPSFSLTPTTSTGSSPAGATAHLHLPQAGLTDPEALAEPPLKKAVVRLPQGLELNPSSANGLEACSEAQIGLKTTEGELPNPIRFSNAPASCPDGSKLGTAEARSPLLEEPLQGTIYLAQQEANPFGSLLAIYLVFESPRFGLTIKLAGKVEADQSTGRLTTTFDYNPQTPVEDLTLNFRGGGPRSELATPEVCGAHTTTGEWEPWSAPQSGPPAQTSDSFTVSGGCSSSLAARPFSPSFEAGTTAPIAGAYSPLVIKVRRNDGEGELRRLDFTLPPGLIGKLAGVPYCPEAAIAQAKAKTGKAEQASPSCPAASKLGTVDAAAGVGPEPFHASGTVYLAGPYEGAPISAVVIAPAVAGPFDLGNVVIRNPLYIDPATAQVTAKSDPIPTILQGIPLKLRSVAIQIDRPDFTLNPTSCAQTGVQARIGSSEGAVATPGSRFQVGNCAALAFKPKLYTRLYGGIHRGDFPRFRAVYVPRQGREANLRNLTLRFPRSEFIEQGHFRTICTRVQYSAGGGMGEQCPKGSVYGHVKAITPLLDEPVEGPVFLRSSDHNLPDVVFALHGQVDAEASVRIDSVKGGLRAKVEEAPDVPLTKVVLEMQGAQKGLFVNSRNICAHVNRAASYAVAHNGRTEKARPVLNNSKCRAYRKKLRKRHHGHHRKGGGKSNHRRGGHK